MLLRVSIIAIIFFSFKGNDVDWNSTRGAMVKLQKKSNLNFIHRKFVHLQKNYNKKNKIK